MGALKRSWTPNGCSGYACTIRVYESMRTAIMKGTPHKHKRHTRTQHTQYVGYRQAHLAAPLPEHENSRGEGIMHATVKTRSCTLARILVYATTSIKYKREESNFSEPARRTHKTFDSSGVKELSTQNARRTTPSRRVTK